MCQVSGKLKLCTCNSNAENLKYYWVYYRRKRSGNEFIMGIPIMPTQIDPETENFNRELLEELLNAGEGFDIELSPKAGDRLMMVFHLTNKREMKNSLIYEFEYKRGKWSGCDWDPFDLENRYSEVLSGKILNALRRRDV